MRKEMGAVSQVELHDLVSQVELHHPCATCGFDLWMPISSLDETQLGLYSDKRFPGRCILTLKEHYDQFDEVPGDTQTSFWQDISRVVSAIKAATGSERVNIAILGNAEGHVHAHLIPRIPENEPFPNKAPWEDTRSKGPLPAKDAVTLIEDIRRELAFRKTKVRKLQRKRASVPVDSSVVIADMISSHNAGQSSSL